MSDVLERSVLARWRREPLQFIADVLRNPKTGQPFELFEAQRQFFDHAWRTGSDGRLLYPEQCLGMVKKTGKTTTAAMHVLTTTLVYAGRYAEAYCIANDFEQAQGRVFTAIKQICESSPLLRSECDITASRITFPQTGAFIQAIGSDYASAAGAHPCVASADELWGFQSERSRRLFDELVPVPTQRISCRLTTTHAGYTGDSVLLEEMYKRGLALPEIAPGLHAGNHLLFYWSHEALAPWQTPQWLAEMREITRPIQYLRQFENRFVSNENCFIDPDWFDACVDRDAKPLLADKRVVVWLGVDASVKRDSTAIVVIGWDKAMSKARLVTHRVFQPSPKEPLDFEATVERTVREFCQRFRVRRVLFDPYQMASVAQRLQASGIPMKEFPQSVSNLTAIGSNLYEMIKGGNLIVYPDAGIRLAISRAVAKETSRGFMITKEKSSHKIDVVIALAMAAYEAVQHQAVDDQVPIVMPYFHSVPRHFPGSAPLGGDAPVAAESPHRPSSMQPWYRYTQGW
jgi:phage terminase large subunit-like protein